MNECLSPQELMNFAAVAEFMIEVISGEQVRLYKADGASFFWNWADSLGAWCVQWRGA